jgi:hypothetical protein
MVAPRMPTRWTPGARLGGNRKAACDDGAGGTRGAGTTELTAAQVNRGEAWCGLVR